MGQKAASSGWVVWPELGERWHDTGEGGMWVHAFWLADYSRDDSDPFVHCCGVQATIALPHPDVVAGVWPGTLPDGRFYQPLSWPRPDSDVLRNAGPPVLAALCLGSTGVSYCTDDDGYFICAPGDLTGAGKRLLAAASQLYEREPVIVTYLDT